VHSIAENFYSLPLFDRHIDRNMADEEYSTKTTTTTTKTTKTTATTKITRKLHRHAYRQNVHTSVRCFAL
jgi:hypothetical protein